MTDLNGSRGMRLITGNSNKPLVDAIGAYLGLTPVKADVRRFSDDEIFVEVHENVRGEDMFLIQSTSAPANDNLMELLIMIDALRRASARRITAVIPYFGYARQDRKVGPRTPISAKLVANLITQAGANRVLTVDLHAGQIQGFFDIPTDNLFAQPVIVKDIQDHLGSKSPMVVSPDVGGVVRARSLARRLNTDFGHCRQAPRKSGPIGSHEYHWRCRGAGLHPDRRHRRQRRHPVQRRRCADQERRHRSLCLLHPWRAVGQGGGADPEFQPQIHGGDGFHRPHVPRNRLAPISAPSPSRRCSARRCGGSTTKPRSQVFSQLEAFIFYPHPSQLRSAPQTLRCDTFPLPGASRRRGRKLADAEGRAAKCSARDR
jgi:phosphoribosylpyrophosphate synthetase